MGGDTLGMEMAGCRVIAFNENNRSVLKLINKTFLKALSYLLVMNDENW